MQNLNDLLAGLGEEHPTTDQTLHVRKLPDGTEVTDFAIEETTNWSGEGIPSTTRKYLTMAPLECGHVVTKENLFAGYCAAKKGWIKKHKCNASACSICLVICDSCLKTVSSDCHATVNGAEIIGERPKVTCKNCQHNFKKTLLKVWEIISHPFLAEEPNEDE